MRLLQEAKQGKFDIVVVHTLDRWARNIGVRRLALQWLGECKTGFASVREDFDYTSPNGRMLMNMLGAYAEFFSDQLAVHVRKAQRHRASLGLPIGPVRSRGSTDAPPGLHGHRSRQGIRFGRPRRSP